MARLHIDIPDELHRRAKLKAVTEQKSLAQTIIELLERKL